MGQRRFLACCYLCLLQLFDRGSTLIGIFVRVGSCFLAAISAYIFLHLCCFASSFVVCRSDVFGIWRTNVPKALKCSFKNSISVMGGVSGNTR